MLNIVSSDESSDDDTIRDHDSVDNYCVDRHA